MATVPTAIALLALSGCSTSGTIGATAGSSGSRPANPAISAPGVPAGSNPLVGTWTGTGSDSASVSLVVTPDGKATLTSPHTCTGTATNLILLDCADGNRDRTTGSLKLDGKTLTISWDIGIDDTLQKTG